MLLSKQSLSSCIGRTASSQRAAARPSSISQAFHASRQVSASIRPESIVYRTRTQSPLRLAESRVIAKGLFGLGVPELAVIVGVVALVFGPSKLPELGKGLGKTVKSFQSAAKEFETELKAAAAPDEDASKSEGDKKPPSA